MKKLLSVTMALLLIVSAFFWVHRLRLRAEAILVGIGAKKEALLAAARQWDLHNSTTKDRSAFRAVAEGMAADAAVPGPAMGAKSALQHLMDDPQMQARYFAARRANLAFSYGPLFRTLGLTGAQTEKLQDLILQRDQEFFDTISTVPSALKMTRWNGTNPFLRQNFVLSAVSDPLQTQEPDAQAAAVLLQQSSEAFQAAASAVVGADAFAQLQQYESTLPVRDVVDGVGATLFASGAPLTDAQAGQLTEVLAKSSEEYRESGVANNVNWPGALADATGVLTPGQLGVLQVQGGYDQAAQQLHETIRQAGGFGTLEKLVPAGLASGH